MLKVIACLFVLISASTCKDNLPFDRVYSFWVENKSDKLIIFLVSYSYPDTIIPDTYTLSKGVSADSKTPFDSDEKWEAVFRKLPADTLSIFIFNADTLNNYDWQIVRSEYNILKRYDLSLEDLIKMNWTIIYPYD